MSLRRLWTVCRLDLSHNLRRPLYWIWIIVLGFFAWIASEGAMRIQTGDASVGGTKAWVTSEFAVAQNLAIFVPLLYCFFIAVAAGMPIIRDRELKIGAVLHATPLRPSEYVWGKLAAAVVSFIAVLFLHVA